MKRIIMLTVSVFLTFTISAHAEDTARQEFSDILNDTVSEYGAFDGKRGVVYASIEHFYYNTEMLFIVTANDAAVSCSVYAVNDGAGCVDTLELDMDENSALSVVIYDDMSYIMHNRGSEAEYFAILDDSFTHIPKIEYSSKTDILRFTEGKADTLSNTPRTLYNFLNSLRLETINSYTYINKVNVVDTRFRDTLVQFLSSCASLTEFNRDSYDYDRLFKYVLFTHESFEDIVPVNALDGESGGIKTVSGEYIDYIMSEILKIPAEHPGVTALTERGFCYKDGMYMYTGGFGADYSTEILELIALHDLGSGNYHVVFSDIYHENESDIPEYSFAIVNYANGAFSLKRLGMGKNLLTEHQISRYSSIADMRRSAWETDNIGEEGDSAPPGVKRNAIILAAALAVLFAFIAAAWWYIVLKRKYRG